MTWNDVIFVIWLRFQDTLNLSKVTQNDYSEWIIAMSHEVTQKVSLVWESPLFEGNPDLVSLKLKVLQTIDFLKGYPWRTTWDTPILPKERLESTRATANVGEPVGLDGQGGKTCAPCNEDDRVRHKFAS